MKKFINFKNEKEIKELLYYYNQGINIGKEETITKIINNLKNMNIDLNTISKITNISTEKINYYIE